MFASVIGFDKERSFYPVVLIVIATYYILFAAMAKSTDALLAEALPMLLFTAAGGGADSDSVFNSSGFLMCCLCGLTPAFSGLASGIPMLMRD